MRLKKIFKALPSVIGAGVGMALGGPAGATMGGALGGSMSRGGQNKFKGALGGAGIGLGYSALAPMAGNALGISGTGPLSGVLGMNSPSLMSQLGFANAPTTGGGLGIGSLFGGGSQAVAGTEAAKKAAKKAAENSGVFSGLNGLLLPLAIGGTLMRRERTPKEKQTLAEYAQQNRPQWSEYDRPRYIAPLNRTYIAPVNPLANTEQLYFNDVNPYMG